MRSLFKKAKKFVDTEDGYADLLKTKGLKYLLEKKRFMVHPRYHDQSTPESYIFSAPQLPRFVHHILLASTRSPVNHYLPPMEFTRRANETTMAFTMGLIELALSGTVYCSTTHEGNNYPSPRFDVF